MSYSPWWAKKNAIHILTRVDRDMHCVLSGEVVAERTPTAPQAKSYYSAAAPVDVLLYYGAPDERRTDQQETYSVEAVNADRRHYLKRLARKSRGFTRRWQSLAKNIQRLVGFYNPRQWAHRLFPK